MGESLRNDILAWFVEKDARGSQTNDSSRAIARAAEEINETFPQNPEALKAEVKRLRDEGLIETKQGEGAFRGAWVTSITQRGRDRLYDQNQIGALIGALEELASALRQHSGDASGAAAVELALSDAGMLKSSGERIVAALRITSASVKTVAAAKPAWNTVVSIATALGIHGLAEIP